MKDEIRSPYITPFLGPDNKDLVKAMDEHQNHQYPLSKEKEYLEGSTTPYSLKDGKHYGRR